ncbi:Protoglobin-domain-containing protein [Halteromyces radiatus]|uniref:Protoglobin-domain-containing protein n=1 Tax=Halteromyces radiatus TaxID=101107 RepID=UPI0022207A8F|nr:Protoglobin-domain-containing protein [Halteromyces radiatus]KAI8086491.1 Protoglobin-domain-containing protein [Halteromyces radiatus]
MQHIDDTKLYNDGQYRFDYVADFMEFGETDIKAIQAVAEQVRPLIPVVVDAVYKKLFTYDVTKRFFLPKNEGFEGETATTLEALTLDHPQIKFRKDFLSRYLNKLLDGPYDDRFLRYLDWVAKIHTDTPQKKSKINVDYIHVNCLMGYVESTLVGGLLSLHLDRDTEAKALAAFNKLLWIQNDYFAKYYALPSNQIKEPSSFSSLTGPHVLSTMMGTLIGGLAVYFGFIKRS